MFLRLTSLPAHVLSAAAEALLLTKAFPHWCPEQGAFAWAFLRLLVAHIAFVLLYYFVFLGLVHPYFLCPLRHLPTASVSTGHAVYYPQASGADELNPSPGSMVSKRAAVDGRPICSMACQHGGQRSHFAANSVPQEPSAALKPKGTC
jgi:hypothetical protein